jgi:hypothetical protein
VIDGANAPTPPNQPNIQRLPITVLKTKPSKTWGW